MLFVSNIRFEIIGEISIMFEFGRIQGVLIKDTFLIVLGDNLILVITVPP